MDRMTRHRIDTTSQAERIYKTLLLKLELGPQSVTIEPYKAPKTNPQLEKVHAMIGDFAISQSRSREDMKVLVKFHLVFTRMVSKSDGSMVEVPKSFAKASKAELSEFIEKLTALAIEYDVELRQ